MDTEELKKWIRENLEIRVVSVDSSNYVRVGLYFKDENMAFAYDYINIPEPE